MTSFSERHGYKKPKQIQYKGLDTDTRNMLWNVMLLVDHNLLVDFTKKVWVRYLKRTFDTVPQKCTNRIYREYENDTKVIKSIILEEEWYKVFDILEMAAKDFPDNFSSRCNAVLKNECCGYRLADGKIVEITSEEEISEIEKAANNNKHSKAAFHIQRALELYSDRQKPDYRNSIKEAISAVENVCREMTGKATLDKALKDLEKSGVVLNPQFKQGLENIYHYTNGKDGIRHAIMDDKTVQKEDAYFMLVLCSAFVNYLILKFKN